ncbi:MAG: helix-turn-helix transcriptional regulator [Clostridia bacterium]|nr:helix-turn-helix transcriptional regulator [Clostridia bacterium]
MNNKNKPKITGIRHAAREIAPHYTIDRPNGFPDYVLVHLWQSVTITIDGESFATRPSACIVYSREDHQKWVAGEEGIIHDWIHMDGDIPALMADAGLEFNKVFYPKSPDFITKTCEELEVEYYSKRKFSEEICSLGLSRLFYLMSRRCSEEEPENINTLVAQRLRSIRSNMLSNIKEQPDIEAISKRLSVCPSKFYSMYKSLFGISPQKDLINARIEKAKGYLVSGFFSVEETADMIGYNNTFHFIRQFKQLEGITPGEYAKKNRQ